VPGDGETLRAHALALFRAAVAAVEPGQGLTHALLRAPPPADRVWILALGKAGPAMAGAACRHLALLDVPLAGGVVVSTEPGDPPHPRLRSLAGDHPLPGVRSAVAADALGEVAQAVVAHDEVWLLLSGGTSSLVGAPAEGVTATDYRSLHQRLVRAGLPIELLNRVRKRFSRWGAGRLAAALRSERVRVFALSDVPGDDPETIGSGPCEPDRSTATEVREILVRCGLLPDLPLSAATYLEAVLRGEAAETPKPEDPCFARRTTVVIGSNAVARTAAEAEGVALGYAVSAAVAPLAGEAQAAGERIAGELAAARRAAPGPRCLLWGGETTVALGPHPGRGGRCQELALAAAGPLRDTGGRPWVLLAAGTDGRDGPTDAAGALVDGETWTRIRGAGLDPAAALEGHDAYPALAAAGALLRTGPTGTNVMDLVVALVG